MRQSSTKVEYRGTAKLDDMSRHGLLAAAYKFAEGTGVFEQWKGLPLKMKTVVYTPADKVKTLWASIVVGCQHTYDINTQLGADEKALAEVFGLTRFPDQSQVNRLLTRATAETVQACREKHLELLCSQTRARKRKHWERLTKKGKRFLVADLDQRALVVSGRQFEFAEHGYFGHHRGHAGYQLSALFLGGKIGEVVDEYFDPGNVQAKVRVAELLASLSEFCRQVKIRPEQVLIRGDAQFGTAANIEVVERYGFKYLFKGLSVQRAKKLSPEVEEMFVRVKPGAEDQARWMADLGEHTHENHSEGGSGKQIRCRTLSMVSVSRKRESTDKHHGKKEQKEERIKVRYDYFLTNLSARELPLERALEVYADRATIERYFNDEQNALGARSVRTKYFHGAAWFQFVIATTSNLLRWFKHQLLDDTTLKDFGLKRFIKQVIAIPARIKKQGTAWTLELSNRSSVAKKLLAQCPVLHPNSS